MTDGGRGEQRGSGVLAEDMDLEDPALDRFDLVNEGARRDGIEYRYYRPRFPVPGTKEERRIERVIAGWFLIAGLAGIAFVVAYIFWPWEYKQGWNINKWYTPVLGVTLCLALLGIGVGIIMWAKKLLPKEVSVQERHDGPSPAGERRLTGERFLHSADEAAVGRRPLLKGALAAGLAPLGLVAIVPLGGLVKDPKGALDHTGWGVKDAEGRYPRLVLEDGTLIRPEDISVGGQITVFPDIPEGRTNKWADSPTLVIHLREEDGAETRRRALEINQDAQWQNFVAYSKICTHAGCPASLYEQQSNILLCPCHQSQFLITDNAKPIFGPAARKLPQLPIEVDEQGYFRARSDYREPIGPSFWERP